MNISLSNPDSNRQNVAFELVISEPGGKVLLDTIALYNTTVKAALKTDAPVVDMVQIDTGGGRPSIFAYKSVNLSTWVNAYPGSYLPRYRSSMPNTTLASVHINHFPNNAPGTSPFNYYFLNNGPVGAETAGSLNPTTHEVDLSYLRYPGANNFFAFPDLGLYKLYVPARDKDTMDFAHLDTLVSVAYPRPFPFTPLYFNVIFLGIPDSTNRSLDINFRDVSFEHSVPNVDLQYPREPMQLYELYYDASTSSNEYIGFYSYGKTVPTGWNMLDASKFTVSASQPDNLSIKCNAPATVALSNWGSANNGPIMRLYWNPDSTNVDPLNLLSGLKAKFLVGAALSSLKCSGFDYEQISGFDYNRYLNYLSDPAKVATHQIGMAVYYDKYF
jgi:hypothetical protein